MGIRAIVLCGLVLAACGGGGGGGDDDAPPDASSVEIDAAEVPDGNTAGIVCPPAPTTGTAAHIFYGTPDVDVIWSEADGTLRGCTKTDASGETELLIEADTMVTFVRPNNANWHLFTQTGVQPGENLVYGAPPFPSAQVHLHYEGQYAGATNYMADLGCGGFSYAGNTGFAPFSDPVDVDYFPLCLTSDNAHVNVYAEAADGNVAIAYAIATDVTLTPPSTDVTLGAWRTDFVDAPVTLSNVPFAAQNHSVQLGWRTDGVDFNDMFYRLDGGPIAMGGESTLTGRRLPAGFADGIIATVTLQDAGGSYSGLLLASALPVGPQSFDVANAMVPPTVSGDERDLTWQSNASLATADVVQVRVRYGINGNSAWIAFVAPDETGFRYPDLPDIVADAGPVPAEVWDRRVFFEDDDSLAGFDDVRHSPQGPLAPEARGRYTSTQY